MTYLKFVPLPWPGVTKPLSVQTLRGEELGAIRWYGPWRQYCFITHAEALVFSAGCLSDIQTRLNVLNDEHWKKRGEALAVGPEVQE